MKEHWRKLASILPPSLERKVYQSHFASLHKKWKESNTSFPPSHLAKQNPVKKIAQAGKFEILVETGTFMGDMVFAMQPHFSKIYSIELSPHFFTRAKHRFRNDKHVTILEGDSGKVLHELVPTLDKPSLFWLDGHYSGGQTALGSKECPIYEELSAIFLSRQPHGIIIDDARLFVGKNDYPTVEELKEFVAGKRPDAAIQFENDAIIITHTS